MNTNLRLSSFPQPCAPPAACRQRRRTPPAPLERPSSRRRSAPRHLPTSLYWLLCLCLVACGPPRGPQATSARTTAAVTTATNGATVEVGSEDEAASLLAAVEAHPDPSQRRAAIDRHTSADGAADPLLRSLNSDGDPLVRRWAALALERRARPDLAPALRQALVAERDPAVENILQRALARADRKAR